MAINEVTFNSVNFWKDLGAALSAPVSYPIPAEVKELVKVKGANGSLTEATGYFNNIEIDLKFKVLIGRGTDSEAKKFNKLKRKINQIFNNISDHRLSFSDIPNKHYIVKTVGVGAVSKISDYEATFEVVFNCDPFLYGVDEPIDSLGKTLTYQYDGDVPNAPVIEITMAGTGELSVGLNGNLLTFTTEGDSRYFINSSPFSLVTDSKGKSIKSSGKPLISRIGTNEVTATGQASTGGIKVWRKTRYLG